MWRKFSDLDKALHAHLDSLAMQIARAISPDTSEAVETNEIESGGDEGLRSSRES